MDATHTSVRPTAAAIRRMVTGACTAAACAVTLLVVAVDWMIYVALDSNTPSMEMVLDRVPRLICSLTRVCSA